MPFRCIYQFILFFTLFFGTNTSSATCIDSIWVKVTPVQCFGLRNGKIRIDSVFGGKKPYYYSIDGQTFSTRPEFESLWTGEYVIYIRDATNCIYTNAVLVKEPEELKTHIMAVDTSVEIGLPVLLSAEVYPASSSIASVEWRPPNLFNSITSASLQQTIYPEESTRIAVEIRDQNGCAARDQIAIHIEKTMVFIPNIIKPGSNQNAYFTIFAGDAVARVLYLQVYSRNGGLIFEQHDFQPNDPLKGWNGRWRGRYAEPGVYAYLAEVLYQNGKHGRFEGSLTIVE
jgi:hypothetical protein